MLAEERFSLILDLLARQRTATVQELCEALGEVAPRIADFAEREGLHAHAKSVTIRYEED